MKKSFSLISPVHRPDRVVESVKHEINKYLARERRKVLPEGVDYWDFDCKAGAEPSSAVVVKVKELGKAVDLVASGGAGCVYIEILAKPGVRAKKAAPGEPQEPEHVIA